MSSNYWTSFNSKRFSYDFYLALQRTAKSFGVETGITFQDDGSEKVVLSKQNIFEFEREFLSLYFRDILGGEDGYSLTNTGLESRIVPKRSLIVSVDIKEKSALDYINMRKMDIYGIDALAFGEMHINFRNWNYSLEGLRAFNILNYWFTRGELPHGIRFMEQNPNGNYQILSPSKEGIESPKFQENNSELGLILPFSRDESIKQIR